MRIRQIANCLHFVRCYECNKDIVIYSVKPTNDVYTCSKCISPRSTIRNGIDEAYETNICDKYNYKDLINIKNFKEGKCKHLNLKDIILLLSVYKNIKNPNSRVYGNYKYITYRDIEKYSLKNISFSLEFNQTSSKDIAVIYRSTMSKGGWFVLNKDKYKVLYLKDSVGDTKLLYSNIDKAKEWFDTEMKNQIS
ncbi:MAG: hypothetical protein KHZ90_09710 [Veillonella parvula]|uniref:Uncharacterized protein n=1 Tax=Veillonella parvula TaxID=29466 RepID=A0A942WR31_VEIPA|nr:hypothetical protein [Veillonella parvula]MBS4894031.1 hypothetical protein [Veillonella parvula]